MLWMRNGSTLLCCYGLPQGAGGGRTINMDSPKYTYNPPDSEYCPISLMELVCTSPEAGGLEDLEYEDWVK